MCASPRHTELASVPSGQMDAQRKSAKRKQKKKQGKMVPLVAKPSHRAAGQDSSAPRTAASDAPPIKGPVGPISASILAASRAISRGPMPPLPEGPMSANNSASSTFTAPLPTKKRRISDGYGGPRSFKATGTEREEEATFEAASFSNGAVTTVAVSAHDASALPDAAAILADDTLLSDSHARSEVR